MGEKHAPKVKDIRHLNSKKGKSYSSFGTTSIIRTLTWWEEVKSRHKKLHEGHTACRKKVEIRKRKSNEGVGIFLIWVGETLHGFTA